MLKPFARALREGDVARARALWQAVTDRLGVIALPDHEGPLFEGVLVARDEPLSLRRVDALARSWEQLDRAYAPCEDPEVRERLEARVRELALSTGLVAELGDWHLFVLLGPAGEAEALGRFTGEHWEALIGPPPTDDDRATAEAFRTYRERI